LANRIRLVVSDVDGTLTTADNSVSPAALEAIRRLEGKGIAVGLASGRALPRLEPLAEMGGVTGPIIAENGAIAKLSRDGEMVDLGYSREPAARAFDTLRKLFPGAIEETFDDKLRLVDLGIRSHGVEAPELRRHLDDVQLLDSGYMLHLLEKGVSKGRTLVRLLRCVGGGNPSSEEVMVFGDSNTDVSMFELFRHSVLIANPRLSEQQRRAVEETAEYASDLPLGEGFAQVAQHILGLREV